MRVFVRHRNVSSRVDGGIARPQVIVNDNAVIIEVDAGIFKLQPFDVRCTPGGNQNFIDDHAVRFAVLLIFDAFAMIFGRNTANLTPQFQHNTVAQQRIGNGADAVASSRGKMRGSKSNSVTCVQALKRLRHFDANRAGADDRKLLRLVFDIPQCLVGQITCLSQTDNG